MQFRFWQDDARRRTWRLLASFALLLVLLVLVLNLGLALGWRLLFPWAETWPRGFFQTNTALVLLFVAGGWWTELSRLKEGGGLRVAQWLGAVPVVDGVDLAHRRLLNVVDEMALASGQPVPQVHVLPDEPGINALVAGWSPSDAVLCVTQGALDHLERAELQGLVAHEFGHLAEDDGALCMHLLALVWGLSLLHGWGVSLMRADEETGRWPPTWPIGLVVRMAGWAGWMTGQLLKAAVSRQREFLADARAIQYTRSRDGLGQVLRKLVSLHAQRRQGWRSGAASSLSFLWLDVASASWWSSHPPLADRIRRIYGAPRPALDCLAEGQRLPVAFEQRHLPVVAVMGHGVLAVGQQGGARGPDTQPAPRDPPPRRLLAPALAHSLSADARTREVLGRLQLVVGPRERLMAVLGLMMTPGNARERAFWLKKAADLPGAARLLDDLDDLPRPWRLPEFERLTSTFMPEAHERRRELVALSRDLLRADGRVNPMDRLWWLWLRHRLGDAPRGPETHRLRPLPPSAGNVGALDDWARRDLCRLTAYVSRLVPQDETAADAVSGLGSSWFDGVMKRFQMPADPPVDRELPDADALVSALRGVQDFPWLMHPQILRAWVEEALNHGQEGLLQQGAADALRLMAGLLETPLPPALAAHFPVRERP